MTTQQDMKRARNANIVELAKRGATPKAIADLLHMHVTGIHRILRKNGAGRRPPRKPMNLEQGPSVAPANSIRR